VVTAFCPYWIGQDPEEYICYMSVVVPYNLQVTFLFQK